MAGNVSEWVNDPLTENYNTTTPFVDPQFPGMAPDMILRGGNWAFGGAFLSTSTRNIAYEFGDFSFIGFRCAASELIN